MDVLIGAPVNEVLWLGWICVCNLREKFTDLDPDVIFPGLDSTNKIARPVSAKVQSTCSMFAHVVRHHRPSL
jgi:hypothetical protein